MNRQLKRANEKSDKRREREQQRRKEQRRESRVRVAQTKTSSAKTSQTKKDGEKDSSKREQPTPGMGRLSGAYLVLVVGIIVTQALVPQRTDTFSLVVHGLFYLILGYFFVLWLYRRGVAQALPITLAAGLGLSLGVEGLKVLLPQLGLPQMAAPEGSTSAPNLLFVVLALPGLIVGTWLGRYIYKRS